MSVCLFSLIINRQLKMIKANTDKKVLTRQSAINKHDGANSLILMSTLLFVMSF